LPEGEDLNEWVAVNSKWRLHPAWPSINTGIVLFQES
jgi:hypothetical protein